MTTFIPIPISSESSRSKRSLKNRPSFIEIVQVDVYPKKWYRGTPRIEEYEPENLNTSEIIRFCKNPDSPIDGIELLDVELIEEYITIKGNRKNFEKQLRELSD